MGGGDLNLKKSWHPSTLRNIERVWKAEQKHQDEQQKIEQLQKELAAERARDEIRTYAEDQGVVRKRDERLDWMYQGPAAMVSRDDYLMGRKIDKTFEILKSQESGVEPSHEDEGPSSSLFRFQSSSAADVTVDLAVKIREDPLFAIMKKEKEQKKNLLNNPVKMKQLQMMLKDSLSKKSKKNKKKKHKHKRKSSNSSSSESEVEKEHHKSKTRHKEAHVSERNHSFFSKETIRVKSKHDQHYDNDASASDKTPRTSEHSRKRTKYEDYPSSRNDGKLSRYEDKYPKYDQRRSDSRSNGYSRHADPKTEVKKKLSEADKERLRQEMMDNAKWREKQREKNVEHYAREDKRDDHVKEGSASQFIRPMLSKAAERGTVENRVKQKIFTIQRKTSDMSSNFARR